jgi:hypothetical protein
VLLALLSISVSDAKPPEESWDDLRQLRPGEAIEVLDARMKSHRGTFATYTQDTIVVHQNNTEQTFRREEVASVKRRSESRRGRNALVGLAIGAAGGLALGAIRGKTYHEDGETPVFIAVWTPIGAGIGAVTGAALPTGGGVTIYRARTLPRSR